MDEKKILVVVIDEYGRALTKESLHRLISELFNKALEGHIDNAVVLNGASVNDCAKLAAQIAGKNFAEWEIIYLHGSKYPPVLLTQENIENLLVLLPNFSGTSAAAIFRVLEKAEAFADFKKDGTN